MNLPFTTARELVGALKSRYFPGFHSLPYNRHEPDKSAHWWLSPTGDNPAYCVGKAIVTTDESWNDPGSVLCGFNVEKGLETDLASTPSQVMQKNWFWHRFMDVANHPLATAIEEAEDSIHENLELCVCGIINEGESWAGIVFEHQDGGLVERKYVAGKGQIAKLAECRNISELADGLRNLTGNDESAWLWVDAIVGKSFSLDPDGPDDLHKCAAMLKPFKRWMTAS